jgi:uncharacterized membrane protein (UPF0127 family)
MRVNLFLSVALMVCGWTLATHAGALETEISVGSARFQVELARSHTERQRGLMFRSHLPKGHGMLFIQPKAAPAAFWMKNTYLHLDLLYFDGDGRLQEIFANVPPCVTPRCPIYASQGPIKYILEINGGSAARLGLSSGDHLRLK